jgi:hypothetical protein
MDLDARTICPLLLNQPGKVGVFLDKGRAGSFLFDVLIFLSYDKY